MSKQKLWERGGPVVMEADGPKGKDKRDRCIYVETSDPMVMRPVAEFMLADDCARAFACVNACAGLKNPAALPELLLLLPGFIYAASEAHEADPYIMGYDPTRVRAALAAVTGEPDNE